MRIIRGFFCVLLTALSLWQTMVPAKAQGTGVMAEQKTIKWKEIAEQPAIDLYAVSAVLLDADSGRVLYEKNGYAPMAMASTTKIMTCILVLEEGCLDEMAEVSDYAASMPKVKLYVKQGERYQVRNLLFSLMLESYNDAAVVLAEHVGRKYLPPGLREKSPAEYTVEESRQAVRAFAMRMNEKARELGCEQTWFITPNGLDATETLTLKSGETVQKEHSTTAAELARIMAYCVKQSPCRDVFRELTRTASYSFSENGRSFTCSNHNAFLNMMEGAFSGKTGFTNKAGYCYVGALERDGRTFIVALLACGWPNNKTYKWSDTKKLMAYGIDNYTYRDFLGPETAYDAGKLEPLPVENGQTGILGSQAYTKVRIAGREDRADGGESAAGVIPPDGQLGGLLMRPDEQVQVDCQIKPGLQAPVRAGTVVGNIFYSVDGQIYLTETIVTADSVEAIDFRWCLQQVWERFELFAE